MALHLLAHPKLQNGIRYCYYTLSQSYREEGRVRKRIVAPLGKLSDEQAEAIRATLRIKNDPSLRLLSLSEIECTRQVRYLDVAVFHELWNVLEFSEGIPAGSGDVELSKLLELLVINRCCEPKSKLGVTRWLGTTALASMLQMAVSSISESRLYRALPAIEAHHGWLEEHLFKRFRSLETAESSSLYFYDLSSSYFEGENVSMAAFSEHSKDHRPDRLQVMLGLLMNEKGLPFSWELFPGNQGEAPTLPHQLQKFQQRFGVERAVLIFDRGFLSESNLRKVEEAGYQYVTGLDAPQIEMLLTLTRQDWLSSLQADSAEEIVSKQKGWHRFDETQFYCPLGIINGRQTVLLFDVARYRLATLRRQEKIDAFKQWIARHNEWLATFKKDASEKAIRKDVETELEKHRLSPYVRYALRSTRTENQTFTRRKDNPYPSQGHWRSIRSFHIEIVDERNQHSLDGVFALITSKNSPLGSKEVIHAYRQKYLIEAAFRGMKSILKLRPWFVYKDEHVKAHYTICVLAYVLERLLDLKLEETGLKDEGLTLGQLKEDLERYRLLDLSIGGKTHTVLQSVPAKTQSILKKLALSRTLSPLL